MSTFINLDEVKDYNQIPPCHAEVIYNKLGGIEIVKAIIRDEKNVSVTITDRIIKFFDKNGRCIPSKSLTAAVCDANRNFYLKQPEVNYSLVIERLTRFFPSWAKFVTPVELQQRIEALWQKINADPQCVNLRQAVSLVVCLPHLPQFKDIDHGKVIEDDILPAVERAYIAEFGKTRKFVNYRKNKLAGQVRIIPGTRYDDIVNLVTQGPVVGLLFPNSLQGFSVKAQREQIKELPEVFSLAGPLQFKVALVEHTDILARDFNTPGYDLSAVEYQSTVRSLFFEAVDGELRFDVEALLGNACGRYSGGLFLVG